MMETITPVNDVFRKDLEVDKTLVDPLVAALSSDAHWRSFGSDEYRHSLVDSITSSRYLTMRAA